MKMAKCIAIHASCAVLLLLVVAPTASADIITISTPNSALSGFTAPYATVDVSLINPTEARIIFTSDTTKGVTFRMGSTGAADLNLNVPFGTPLTVTFDAFPPPVAGFGSPLVSTYGSVNQVGGFGGFTLAIDLFDGFHNSANQIGVNIIRASGTWASAADVLTANADGNLAAIHAFACANPTGAGCSEAAGVLAGKLDTGTGFAANGSPLPPPPPVPEPGSLLFVGSGLVSLIGLARRRLS